MNALLYSNRRSFVWDNRIIRLSDKNSFLLSNSTPYIVQATEYAIGSKELLQICIKMKNMLIFHFTVTQAYILFKTAISLLYQHQGNILST